MNLSDIIALAKAGYKPADIKELVELSVKEPAAAEPITEPAVENPKPQEEVITEMTEEMPSDPEPDYKKLYEQTQLELKKAEEMNIRTNHQPEGPSDAEQVSSMVTRFL